MWLVHSEEKITCALLYVCGFPGKFGIKGITAKNRICVGVCFVGQAVNQYHASWVTNYSIQIFEPLDQSCFILIKVIKAPHTLFII